MNDQTGLVSIHVGHPDPANYVEPAEGGRRPLGRRRSTGRPTIMDPALDWSARGAMPAWLGSDTAQCAAAFESSLFHGRGADELKRFLAAAKQRSEPAILVAKLGDADDDMPRSVMASCDASLSLPDHYTQILADRLPIGGRPSLVPGVSGADRDLGLRLLNRPADAPWWSLRLGVAQWHGAAPLRPPVVPAGTLQPILVDALGGPVVAVWISPEEDERWYLIPDRSDWGQVIDWVVRQALPAYAPDALRRVRSPLFHDPLLRTSAESTAEQVLADMEVRHAEERAELEAQLHTAREAAEPIREALLHGSGSDLAGAVQVVLTASGFQTMDLDAELGGTKSADVLAVRDGHRILVEVKSAGGNPSESLVADLQRHLTTWPSLRPDEPVHGAALIVNHQHKLPPHERSTDIYTRPEFVGSLQFPVISTMTLFNWWRAEDWPSIRTALLGEVEPERSETSEAADLPLDKVERRRRWFGRSKSDPTAG
jgi:hypothetical protein